MDDDAGATDASKIESRSSDNDESNSSDRQESEEEEVHRKRRRGQGGSCGRSQGGSCGRGQLVCPVCGQSELEDEHQLTLHIRSHHNNNNSNSNNNNNTNGSAQDGDASGAESCGGPTQCKVCGKVLGSVSSLDRHLLVHSGERPFSCRVCGTRFTTNGNMHRHMRSHDLSNLGAEENHSQKKRKQQEFNNNNIELDSGPEPKRRSGGSKSRGSLGCSYCPAHFASPGLLEAHLDREHRRSGEHSPLSCPECRRVFRSPKLLQKHRTTEHPQQKTLQQDLGLIEFSTGKFPMIVKAMMASEQQGMRKGAGGSSRRKDATVVDEDDDEEGCLKLVVDDTTGEKSDFMARLDLKKLNLREDDSDSASTKDSEGSPTPSSGPVSSGVFDLLSMTPPDSCSRHLQQAHHQQPDEEEQDCFSAELRRMKLRGEFPCRLCPSVFPNLRALKGHNRVHLTTGQHPAGYECNMCEFRCDDKSAVVRHMRTHNGDRPYECALCNYAFTTKANCERHLRNRHAASRCDLKRSIIYHPSEDPTNDQPQREVDVKRSLFPDVEDSPEEDIHQSPLLEIKKEPGTEAPLDLSMDALDLSKKKRRDSSEEDDKPQDLTTKKVIPHVRPFTYTDAPYFLPHYFMAHQVGQVFGFPRDFVEINERLQMLRTLSGGLGEAAKPLTPVPVQEASKPQVQVQDKVVKPQSSSSVKMVIKNGVLVPKQKQRRYRTERPFGCEHCSAKFTLRSNMERHVKQQHPQFWTRRGSGRGGGQSSSSSASHRRSQATPPAQTTPTAQDTPTKHILNNNNNEPQKTADHQDTKDKSISQGVKLAIVEQLKAKIKLEGGGGPAVEDRSKSVSDDLASVSKLLDNASTQTFRQYFQHSQDGDSNNNPTAVKQEPAHSQQEAKHLEGNSPMTGMSDDEEGLVASHSEENSGSEENKSENESATGCGGGSSTSSGVAKKKSAYSLAPNRVSCPYCFRKFPWSSSLRRHILTHTGQKPFKCQHCPLLFTTKSNCDRHLARKHGASQSQQPSQVSQQQQAAVAAEEQSRNVPERPFKCSRCPSSTFSTLGNLKKHLSKHDDTGSSLDSAEEQPAPAPTVSSGVQPSSEIPFFKCHLCEGAFVERQDALDHLRDTHEPEYNALVSKGALESSCEEDADDHHHHHQQETSRGGKFPDYANRKVMCAFCLRRFWSAEDLRRHMRTHTGERPFSCDVCTRKFTLKHSMLRHRKKHACNTSSPTSGQRPDAPPSPTPSSAGPAEDSDLIGNLLGIGDRSLVDRMLEKSADVAAKLLGVVQTK